MLLAVEFCSLSCKARASQETLVTKQYLVLVRHGQSEANLRLASSPDGLYYSNSGSDPLVPLTQLGLVQGDAVAKHLRKRFRRSRRIVRVYHNEYQRVEQFADRVAARLGYDVERLCDARLNKRSYGDFWNLTYHGVQTLHPQEWERYQTEGAFLYRPPGGENYPDVFARVDDFVDERVKPSSENQVIVTSSVVLLSFIRKFEQLSDEELIRQYESQAVPNAYIVVYCRDSADQPWRRCSLI